MSSTFRITLFSFSKCTFKWKGTQPTQKLSIHLKLKPILAATTFTGCLCSLQMCYHFIYLFIIIMPIKCTFLFALFTVDGRSILNFRICASLTLVAYECSDNITVLASSRFAVRFNILLTLFTYSTCASFCGLLKFWSTIGAFNHRKCSTTFLSGKRLG